MTATTAPAASGSTATPTAEPTEVSTPGIGRVARRAGFWIALVAAVVIVTLIVTAVTRPRSEAPGYLSIESTASDGARALVEVLRDQGVDVRGTSSLAATREVVGDADDTTLVLFDALGILRSEQREELLGLAGTLVVIEPWDSELAELAPGVVQGSGIYQVTRDDCDVAAVDKAETVDAVGLGYLIEDAAAGTVGCLEDDGGQYGLVRTVTDGTTVTLLGLSSAFTNGEITREGNAALALNLLGEHRSLVWYVPSYEDLAQEDIPTLADLTPPWVTPLAILLLLVAIAAMFWRGRRVGPLVVENLPVVVRANETMEGRARLYDRAGARVHAADALRIGTVSRLATRCGLPRGATVDEVADAVAALIGRHPDDVSEILIDRLPGTDSDLVRISDELLRLETDVERVVRSR